MQAKIIFLMKKAHDNFVHYILMTYKVESGLAFLFHYFAHLVA